MEKGTPKASEAKPEKKQYVKPELTKHKALREITMASMLQVGCSTCTVAAGGC